MVIWYCNINLRPSRQSRNRCIRSKTSRYNLDLWTGWIRWRCDAHKKQVDVRQLYNPVPQTVWVSWSQFVGVRVAVRGNENQLETEGLGPQDPGWAAQQNEEEFCYDQRNLGSVCCSLFRLQLTSHTQPFCNPSENKVWEVYFSKKVSSFVIIVDNVSAYICIHIAVSRLYNNNKCSSLTEIICT